MYPVDSEAIGEAETAALCSALSVFARGPNEELIERLLAAGERLNKRKESCTLRPTLSASTPYRGTDGPRISGRSGGEGGCRRPHPI